MKLTIKTTPETAIEIEEDKVPAVESPNRNPSPTADREKRFWNTREGNQNSCHKSKRRKLLQEVWLGQRLQRQTAMLDYRVKVEARDLEIRQQLFSAFQFLVCCQKQCMIILLAELLRRRS